MKKYIVLILAMSFLFSCEHDDIDQDANSRENPLNITIVRKQQRTLRYDCNGTLTTDRFETLNSVTRRYIITPKVVENVFSFSATNGRTTRGALSNSSGTFSIDMSPTIFNLRVYPGLNSIDYSFKYCQQVVREETTNANGSTISNTTCAHKPNIEESGTLYININYSREVIPGVREFRNSQAACAE